MNAGNIGGIIVLIAGFIFIKKKIKKRITKEVKIIDNISYPKYAKRQGRENRTEGRSRRRNPINIRFGL